MVAALVAALISLPSCASAAAPVPRGIDPYPYLYGGSWGPAVSASPDPTANYTWDLDSLEDPVAYQCIHDIPVEAVADPAPSFLNLETMLSSRANVTVLGSGVIRLGWPQTGACWIEFVSPDLPSADIITVGLSESDMPAPLEAGKKAKQYGSTWRLEPNAAFYEGVRFAWLNVTSAPSQPFHITGLQRVCQVVPTNYRGHFESSDPDLDRIWWVGAYTVKVTLNGNGAPGKVCPPGKTGTSEPGCGGFLGSELIDRGDRIAFLGDAHAAQAAAMVAFGNYQVLASSNNYTKNIPNNIEPYWVMWVNSVIDYWDATADRLLIDELTPWVVQRLERAKVLYKQALTGSAQLQWSRDDDRIGFGFEFPDIAEAQLAFRALTIEACSRWSGVMQQIGNVSAAKEYHELASNYIAELKLDPDWWKKWGMHASADAINAGILTHGETEAIVTAYLSDRFQLPSLSNFESHFVLRALGAANASDQALALVRRHWAYVTDLGATTTWERYDPEWHDVGALHVNGPPVNAMNDRSSMAHPWAAGATTFLSNFGLGIRPTSPGYRTWEAVPRLMGAAHMGRLEFVRGRVPVPGEAAAGFEMDLRRGACMVEVPRGTVAQVGVPRLQTGLRAIYFEEIAGTPVGSSEAQRTVLWMNSSFDWSHEGVEPHLRLPHGIGTMVQRGFVVIEGLGASQLTTAAFVAYKLRFEHVGDELGQSVSPQIAKSDANPPVEVLGIDKDTSGKWIGKYGQAGYVLFNYSQGTHQDVVSLKPWTVGIWAPTFTDSRDLRGQGLPQGNYRQSCSTPWNPDLSEAIAHPDGRAYQCAWIWDNVSDDRVPQSPEGSGVSGAAAAVRGANWGGSFHVDVEFNTSASASIPSHVDISLYLVDYQRWWASAVVKAMDLETKSTIARMVLVTPEDYNSGVYIRYRYPTQLGKGMRFRIQQVHSKIGDQHSVRSLGFPPRTMVSAVFLDEAVQPGSSWI